MEGCERLVLVNRTVDKACQLTAELAPFFRNDRLVGPVERLLNMLGHQHACASAYALAFGMNVALCFALVPRYGGHGAAAATSISLAFETVLLFWIVRRRLGLHVLVFGKKS